MAGKVLATAELQREEEADYLRWRFGGAVAIPQGPQLPVIPLGIHAEDFAGGEGDRARARAELSLDLRYDLRAAVDEVAGRLMAERG